MLSKEELSHWRFWPVFILAFFYPMNNGMINLVVPIYYLQEGLYEGAIGVLSAGITLAYTFSPLLLNKFSQKIKRKTSIIISLTGVFLSELVFYFTLNPILFIISRTVEGIFMGLYWPNLQSSISDNIFHEHRKLTAKYNISWNLGILGGFLLGALLLFVFELLEIIFYIAPILLLINLIIAIGAFQEPKKINIHSKEFQEYIKKKKLNLVKAVKIKEEKEDFTKMSFPLIFPVLLVIGYCLPRASINFLYPIKSELLNFEPYTVYIAIFFLALSQMISMIFASLMKLRRFNRIPPIMVGILVLIFPIIGINQDFLVFIVLFLIIGSCTGILYGVSLRLFLILNMKENKSKYSAILESILGVVFLITPILSGFIAAIDLNATFYILTSILIVLFFALLILSFKKVNFEVSEKENIE